MITTQQFWIDDHRAIELAIHENTIIGLKYIGPFAINTIYNDSSQSWEQQFVWEVEKRSPDDRARAVKYLQVIGVL